MIKNILFSFRTIVLSLFFILSIQLFFPGFFINTVHSAPRIEFTAVPTSVDANGTTRLIWAARGAEVCSASGDWSGDKPSFGFETVGPLSADSTFTLSCIWGSKQASRSVTVSVESSDESPLPSLSLNSNTSSVAHNGTATLTWSSENATSCSASGGWSGSKATSGVEQVGPLTANSVFTMECTGSGGGISKSVSIVVAAAPIPTITFTATPSTVDFNGTSTLIWSAENANICIASGDWSGTKSIFGRKSVGPLTVDSTYNLTCTGDGGEASGSTTITVAAAPTPIPTITFTATPSTVDSNESSTLTWSAENADTCIAAGDWSGSKPIFGRESVGPLTVDSTYNLTCTGDGGEVSGSTTITVATLPIPTIAFTATPSTVDPSESSTLTWSAENADTCIASDDWSGNKSIFGTESVGPLIEDSIYSLTCTGDGGEVSDSTIIVVNQLGQGAASLSWTPPTTNEDSSPLNDLAGYKIKYGTNPDSFPNIIDVPSSGIASYVVEDLPPNTYYFIMTAYNSAGIESLPSNAASAVIE